MSKLTIPFEKAWLVRTSDGPDRYSFWVAGNKWDKSPMHATIFRSEDDANYLISDMQHYNRAGFSPGSIVEAVPLEGAAKTLGTWVPAPDSRPRHGGSNA